MSSSYNRKNWSGEVYYSKGVPKGSGEVPYHPEAYNIMNSVLGYNKTRENVRKAQDILFRIGYLDKEDYDKNANLGPLIMGAARRYILNTDSQRIANKVMDWSGPILGILPSNVSKSLGLGRKENEEKAFNLLFNTDVDSLLMKEMGNSPNPKPAAPKDTSGTGY
tara:strand:- start:362 stop:856 length:495 start_codon:yes stop_codon:yes gene_type:complete